jgi:hypothetical protein
MLQDVYNIQVWCLVQKSEDHSVQVQHVQVYVWQQQCTHLSLGTKWILPDIEPADTGGRCGIHFEWVAESSMYRILCECVVAYIGETGCSIKTSITDSSILKKSSVVERGINVLLKYKDVLTRKKQPHKLHHVRRDSD